MSEQSEWTKRGQQVLMNTYQRGERVFTHGKGAWITNAEGQEFLDFVSGIATNVIGHADSGLAQAIYQQAKTLIHTSNLYWNQPAIELAEALVNLSSLEKAFFANSGTEANEGAIKLARKWGQAIKGESATEIITMKHSFHGRTFAALSATGQPEMHQNIGPMLTGFKYVPFNDVTALKSTINQNTCAILVEIIQGEGGINIIAPDFIKALMEIQQEHNVLIMIDEVQTGMGRTGTLFAYQNTDLKPDIITLAKGLGGGFPIGAILAKESIAQYFGIGSHGTTFGGNPLATAAGKYIVEEIQEKDLLANVQLKHDYLMQQLKLLQTQTNIIKDIRGWGLLLGLELDVPVADVIQSAYTNGLLVTSSKHNVLRLLPPLNVNTIEIDVFIERLAKTLSQLN